ncbi:4Fe-4S dicluster domain-containing protein [Candidatus Bathyarchaeota archaeon]|nr:4Fe-4S dicluster domain-containing protein [Candidatus Bathyarchaeota archaeon]
MDSNLSAAVPEPMVRLAVYPDRCRGCGLCELVCSTLHEGESRPSVSRIKVEKDRENYRFTPSVCVQCTVPKCLFACPTGAVKVDERTGARYIDEDLCTGCGLCAEACPFASEGTVIFMHPSKGVYVKCDLCRRRSGGPACVEVCPTHAIVINEKGGR